MHGTKYPSGIAIVSIIIFNFTRWQIVAKKQTPVPGGIDCLSGIT